MVNKIAVIVTKK